MTSQEKSSRLTPRIPENSWSSGTTRVCCSATTVPDSVRTMITAQVGDRFRGGADDEGASEISIAASEGSGLVADSQGY